MRVLEKTLHEDLTLNFARNLGADTYARVADIINKMERGHIEDMLKSLSEKRPKSAEVLKELLFTFDDVVNLTPKARMLDLRSDRHRSHRDGAQGRRQTSSANSILSSVARARAGWSSTNWRSASRRTSAKCSMRDA